MIVEMQKLVLVAHSARRNRILRALHRSKLVMVSATSEIENTTSTDRSFRIDELKEKQQKIMDALVFLREEKKKALRLQKDDKSIEYSPIKTPLQSMARISYEEYTNIPAREIELLAHVQELEDIEKEYAHILSEKVKSQGVVEQLSPFLPVTAPLSVYKDTLTTEVGLGHVPYKRKKDIDEIVASTQQAEFEVFHGEKHIAVAYIVLKDEANELKAKLQKIEFSSLSLSFDKSAQVLIEEEKKKQEELDKRSVKLLTKSLAKESYIAELKQLYDYYLVELAKQHAVEQCKLTNSVFVLEGWFPKCQAQRLEAILNSTCDELTFEFRDAEDDEEVPTLVSSKKVFDPYEDVTNLYSTPNYKEDIDPNPIMSFFYFLFFGVMVADAVYGIILAIGAFLFYKMKKPTPGKGRLLLVIAMGGISTVIWGALFGSWFGLELGGSFLGKIVWFEPLSNPLLMLVVCLLLGVFQIIVGMGVNAYNLIRKKRVPEAVFSVFTWYLVFLGIGLMVLNSMLIKHDAAKYSSIALIVIGLLGMVFGNAWGKKGAKAIILSSLSGFGKIYDGVNILSDVLSYSRLFGLALSGGVVGMVINRICAVIIDIIPSVGGLPIFGVLVAAPIFMIGHLFNVGISTLGAYVHNCRLQYIEFYGKFYTGAGLQFKPLGHDTKYTYIYSSENNR